MPGHEIIFNGPHKTRTALELAVMDGAKIHLDSFDELYLLLDVARTLNVVVPVGIGLTLTLALLIPGADSAFILSRAGNGLRLADRRKQIPEADGIACTYRNVHLRRPGLRRIGHLLCGFMDRVEANTESVIEYIDLGGGFCLKRSLPGDLFAA